MRPLGLGVLPSTLFLLMGLLGGVSAQANGPHAPDEVTQALAAARQAEARDDLAQAELWLERALLLQPENAQALFDWARILLRRGQTDAGTALLQSLVQDPRTPAAQRQRLQALIDGIERSQERAATPSPKPLGLGSQSAASPWRGQWELSLGQSRNPLVQPGVREVVLTLPQGELALPLQNSPRQGTVAGARVLAEHAKGLLLQAQTQAVASQGVPSLRLGALWNPLPSLPNGGVYFQAQRLADATRRVQGGVQGLLPLGRGKTGPLATLVLQAGAYREAETQRHGATGRITAVYAPSPAWQLAAWEEAESRTGETGPPAWRGRGVLVDYKPRTHLSFSMQVLEQKDTSGYSPLLQNNAPRHLTTAIAQAEWNLAKPGQSGWVVRGYAGRRLSNLPLFAWGDTGFTLAWRAPL